MRGLFKRYVLQTRWIATAFLSVAAGMVYASESFLAEAPAPENARGLYGAFQKSLQDIQEADALFPGFQKAVNEHVPALSGGTFAYDPRFYYFRRDNLDGSRSEAFTGGGRFYADTGWLYDFISFGGAYYRSDKISGEKDEGGTGLLMPVQQSFDVLGEAYVAVQYQQQVLKLYRQTLDLPYLNKSDTRMVPNAFEAYMLKGRFEDTSWVGDVEYSVGYVDQIKPKVSDSFISMSRAAGVPDVERGLGTAGVLVHPTTNYSIGAINHFVDDVMNTFYAESNYSRKLTDDLDMRFDLQFTHQQSVGDDLLTGTNFNTWALGGRVAASWKGLTLKAAASKNDEEERLRNPYGSYPGYLSLMQADFKLANEEAWLAGVSYNFDRVGLGGLSSFVNYAEGRNAQTAAGADLPDRKEFNVTADYKLDEGLLRGLWLRVRWSTLDYESVENDRDEFRVILNYQINLL